MKLKGLKTIFILNLIFLMVFVGCSPKNDEELFYESQKLLSNIESYSCEAEITVVGNKKPETYIMKQWFKKPNLYRLEITSPEELKDKTTVSDGSKAWIYHPRINQTWLLENFDRTDEQSMFLGYFIKNYISSEQVEISKKKTEEREYLVIDTDIPGNHLYFSKERLWLEIDHYKPFKLQVFDAQDNMRIEVKYLDFQYNPKLPEDIFNIQMAFKEQ
ncbi:MAG: LolA family protein [Bacillota bacterium]